MKKFEINTIGAAIIYITGAAVIEYYMGILVGKAILHIADKLTEEKEA